MRKLEQEKKILAPEKRDMEREWEASSARSPSRYGNQIHLVSSLGSLITNIQTIVGSVSEPRRHCFTQISQRSVTPLPHQCRARGLCRPVVSARLMRTLNRRQKKYNHQVTVYTESNRGRSAPSFDESFSHLSLIPSTSILNCSRRSAP